MKKATKFIIAFLTIIFINQINLAQDTGNRNIGDDDEFTKIIPPSPTAYELGKYGQIPVGYFTGTPNISVPLYTYKAGNLSVPISLSYNSNGIKVDQLSSNVGLGWSLNVGGVITRIVKDEPDEEGYEFYPESQMQDIYGPVAVDYFSMGSEADKDTEADVFMYNFMGHSGKFVYANDKRIVQIPVKDLAIVPTELGYTITTSDGVIYEFTDIEKTNSLSQVISKSNRVGNVPLTTAWYLSKITHPAGDQINFTYDGHTYSYDNSISQSHYRSFSLSGGCSGGPSCIAMNNLVTTKSISAIYGKKISKISSNNDIFGEVDFNYNYNHPDVTGYTLLSDLSVYDSDELLIDKINFNYLSTPKKRVFLTDLTFADPTKKYVFDYIDPESLCERLSYSQDYWGYYNDEPNLYLLPKIDNHLLFNGSLYSGNREPINQFAQKGLLKKITYPTKGYNEFEYEPNTYFGDVIVYPPQDHLSLNVFAPEYGTHTDVGTTSEIQFDHEAMINASVMLIEDDPDCTPTQGDVTASIQVKDLSTNSLIEIYKYDDNLFWHSIGTTATVLEVPPNPYNEFKVYFIEGHTYEITLKVIRPCIDAALTLHYYDEELSYEEQEIETGGSRIKRIIATDDLINNPQITRYYYNEYSKRNESSGEIGAKGYFISQRINRISCYYSGSFYDCEYYILNSNSLIPLINTGNNNIYYKYVTVSFGGDEFENGGETHEFEIHRDEQGYVISGNGFAQSPSSWSNFGWDNGLEKSVRKFKVENGIQKTVSLLTNNYTNDERLSDTVYSYAITKNFEMVTSPLDFTHECTEAETLKYTDVRVCRGTDYDPDHKCIWMIALGVNCIGNGAYNTWERYYHPCFGKTLPYTYIYPNALENLNIIEYMNLSSWNYLSSSTLHEYDSDNSGAITKTTNYYYDNPQHLQISRVSKNESAGTTQSQMYYPQDYTTTLFDELINKNIIVPIDQRVVYEDKLTNGTLIKYNDIGQPIEIHKAEEEKGNELVFDETNPYSYGELKKMLEYNPTDNNLVSYKNVDDVETTILWGYNYSKPIVKIVNASFSQVTAILTGLGESYAGLQLKSSEQLLAFMPTLRQKLLLVNAMATSYTYDPLIGMTSTTDQNGYVTTYHYDQFGRLQSVKDRDGNILKHHNYHYQE